MFLEPDPAPAALRAYGQCLRSSLLQHPRCPELVPEPKPAPAAPRNLLPEPEPASAAPSAYGQFLRLSFMWQHPRTCSLSLNLPLQRPGTCSQSQDLPLQRPVPAVSAYVVPGAHGQCPRFQVRLRNGQDDAPDETA